MNLYRILGVSEYANDQQIRQAYRTLAKRYHPDLNPGDARAAEKFKEVASAYEVLSDPILRSNYDKKRLRESLYSPGPFFAASDNQKNKTQTATDRRAKYSEATWEWAETKRKRRLLEHFTRRRKIFVAMVITFVLFITAAFWFDNWVQEQRKEFAAERELERYEQLNATDGPKGNRSIVNFDSPFDKLFGPGVYDDFSPHSIMVLSPPQPTVICLVEERPPWRTIRNEYLEANSWIVLRDIPAGTYFFKINTGFRWNTQSRNGVGGFTKDDSFYISAEPSVKLYSPAGTSIPVADTLSLNPLHHHFTPIKPDVFFARELTRDPRK
ncbi:MAG: J domain-containing protein [Bacteroidetes bacterium]|nr:J domain-containing protein [Bacteroidota bacterium]